MLFASVMIYANYTSFKQGPKAFHAVCVHYAVNVLISTVLYYAMLINAV